MTKFLRLSDGDNHLTEFDNWKLAHVHNDVDDRLLNFKKSFKKFLDVDNRMHRIIYYYKSKTEI